MSELNSASAEIVVGLDLGSTKVAAIVGEIGRNHVEVLGVGCAACRGIKRGVVVNIEWTVRAIREAIGAAQTMAGVEIAAAYVGVSGGHVREQLSHGICAIANRQVRQSDLDHAIQVASAFPIETDRMILRALPLTYGVDDCEGIRDPIGMSGTRLRTHALLLTAATSCVQLAQRCVERSGLHVAGVALQPLASADAVISEDEKECGAAVIDIGGGTTDIVVYADERIAHVNVIPAGGNDITRDIAVGLCTRVAEAERLKRNYDCTLGCMCDHDEAIEVPGAGGQAGRRVKNRMLGDIIEPRVEEIFATVRQRLEQSGFMDQIASGCVLTGGAALMPGIVERAEEILGVPLRLGLPVRLEGMNQPVQRPEYAAGIGLLQHGAHLLAEAHSSEPGFGSVKLNAGASKASRKCHCPFRTCFGEVF